KSNSSLYTRFCNHLEKGCNIVIGLMLAVLVIVISLQVFSRFMNKPLLWTVDVSVILMNWFTLIGTAICVRKGTLFTIHIFPETMRKTTIGLNYLTIVSTLSLGLFFLIIGTQFVLETKSGVSGMARIPLPVTYSSLPLSGLLVSIFSVEHFLKSIRKE